MRLLTVNPGRTSTKIAVSEDKEQVLEKSVIHTQEELSGFSHAFDQFSYRKRLILKTLEEEGVGIHGLSGMAGRGGLMNPTSGSTYRVNKGMPEDLEHVVHGEHPSSLGAVLTRSIGDQVGVPSFMVGPVLVDELMPKAGISGISDPEHSSWFHALNHKAAARWAVERIGKKYEESNLIIVHLGSRSSVVTHKNGQMTDGSRGRTNDPFSPERSGRLPTYLLVELCYSGKYTREEMVAKISNTGGMYDYLNTKDAGEVERRMGLGDKTAKLAHGTFVYVVAKEMCSYVAVFERKVDCIVPTGNIARSQYVIDEIRCMTGLLAPVEVVIGEFEMIALVLEVLRVLKEEEESREYE